MAWAMMTLIAEPQNSLFPAELAKDLIAPGLKSFKLINDFKISLKKEMLDYCAVRAQSSQLLA
jgi:hypothetical protein